MNNGKELYNEIEGIKFNSLEEALNYNFSFELITKLSTMYQIMLLDNYLNDNNLTKTNDFSEPKDITDCIFKLLNAKGNDKFFYTLELIRFRNPILNDSLSLILKE